MTVHQTATPTSDLKAVPLPQINDTQEHIILNEALARPPESHSDTQHLTAHNEHSSESSNCPHTESTHQKYGIHIVFLKEWKPKELLK